MKDGSLSTIDNPNGYRFLIIISMLYMSTMLCNAVLTNRYIGTDKIFVLGGTFSSPFIFLMDGIIAEIYGYKIAQCVIISGFLCQAIFTAICQIVVVSPHPGFFQEEMAYSYIFGPSLMRIGISGFIAYISANLLNSYIISRWKVLLKGKKFWMRSLGASVFSEGVYSFIAILMMEIKSIPMNNIMNVIVLSYAIKATYSVIFAAPSTLLIDRIKKFTGIDVYDLPKRFTPFEYLKPTQGANKL